MILSPQDASVRDRLGTLVSSELVAEHRARPFGPHSPALAELMDFLRRNPAPDLPRYVVLDTGRGFRIGVRPAARGDAVQPAGDEVFRDGAAAEHAVFLRRLRDYGLLP